MNKKYKYTSKGKSVKIKPVKVFVPKYNETSDKTRKIAILFGNDNYPNCSLNNAANDANALSQKLSELGFTTKCIINSDIEDMDIEINSFSTELDNADVGLFFFAGHGLQCSGKNYLTSINTNFFDEPSLRRTAYSLDDVINIFEKSQVATKIIILDACRDNPFGSTRGIASEGLAPVYAPKGTIIGFSTSPGQKASDGNGEHGIYTKALLTHIGSKRIAIEDMFKRVRNTVSSQTQNRQITWEHTSLMGTFYFNSGFDDSEASFVYSQEAIIDKNFFLEVDENPIHEIISNLKSYNWYIQNRYFKLITASLLNSSDRDDLFVLGRNIYQAACGDAGYAVEWIENIHSYLEDINPISSTHLLNGILFEVYFNSYGKLREAFKNRAR